MAVIGIDFGTTASKVGILDEFGRAKTLPNAEGFESTPSVITFQDTEVLIGQAAANLALAHPDRTVSEFKMMLGKEDVLHSSKQGSFTAIDCAGLLLEKLKRDAETSLGEPVTAAVLSCPANFRDDCKEALLKAAKQAHLRVSKIIHEPTAAGAAYGAHKGKDQTILVSDLGGGTFDASLIQYRGQHVDVLGTLGINVGGRDYTRAIEAYCLKDLEAKVGSVPRRDENVAFYQDLKDRCEQAKLSLTTAQQTTITLSTGKGFHTVTLTRADFENLVRNLTDQVVATCVDLLKECSLSWDELDQVLLVGGGNRLPSVKEALERVCKVPVARDIPPIAAISYGAAISAAIEESQGTGVIIQQGRAIPAPRIQLSDVTAHGIGCAVTDPVRENIKVNALIIPKRSPIPCQFEDRFRLRVPDQTGALVQILQGNEGQNADDCLAIGQLELEDLPPDPKLPQRIKVTYCIDPNGMATAYAEDTISGKKAEMQFDYSQINGN